MTLLITGGSGTLGKELKKQFPDALSPTKERFNLLDYHSMKKLFDANDINFVIHTAAMTSVRECDEKRELAYNINYVGTRLLVKIARQIPNLKFVYISTACVFDGYTGMYDEQSLPLPENFYGLTKLLGEYEAKKIPNPIVIRTNFVGREKWPYPKAFTDRFGTYLFADQVAYAVKEILLNDILGTIHITGDKKLSMFELAKMTTPEVEPMTLEEYSGPRLTIDMSLGTRRWKKYKISEVI